MDSEYRTYDYIRRVLADLGWNPRNPRRDGDVYTQGEFNGHDQLLTRALGRKAPENIVLIPWEEGFRYWIVEAKRSHSDLGKALEEAKAYADAVNEAEAGAARFATGIAGSPDDSFLVGTCYWDDHGWKEISINDHQTTGFLSREQCQDILERNSSSINLFDDDPDRFLKKANAINKTLRDNDIAVGDRAKVLGALLLALAAEGHMSIHANPRRMAQEVNSNIDQILREHGKEDFKDTISLALPATDKNHSAFRKAIVETLQHLREMNVRSAINSGDDALGKFYETFLKYANGAKEMGIVLTPRHITKMAVEVLGVNNRDRVYDPSCGTGGFLVSAMDHVRRNGAKDSEYAKFKNCGLWGVEKEDSVYGLALVNMIFRGDGQSGLQDGDCFKHEFWQRDGRIFYISPDDRVPDGATRPFSRALMNPPFRKENQAETEFVDHALRQCKPGALLFAVLPHVNIGGSESAKWRVETLKRHTVKAVIKFDKNLFYPVQAGTYGLILEAHAPHDMQERNNVFMGFLFDDNSRPRISKVLSRHDKRDNVEDMTERLRDFIIGKPLARSSIPREMTLATLKFDEGYSYCPEAYIDNIEPAVPDVIDRALAFRSVEIKAGGRSHPSIETASALKAFPLMDFVSETVPPPLRNVKDWENGDIPVVSATATNNGVSEWKKVPECRILSRLMSISHTHNTKPCQAFWHPYRFSAIGTVHLIRTVAEFANSTEAMLYLCQTVTEANSWRYDYARTVKLSELEVHLPIQPDGSVDFEEIISITKRQISQVL